MNRLEPCGQAFVEQMRPILDQRDADVLVQYLACRYRPCALQEFLICGHDDAVKVALFCLSLTGDMSDGPAIAALLHHSDVFVVDLAESALWSIWFRAGSPESSRLLRHAVCDIDEERCDLAVRKLSWIVDREPAFAEAYHQRAIAAFLTGDYARARADLCEALRLNPHHFGALAGLGHCCVTCGKLDDAIDAYRRALQIHPRAEGLRQAVHEVQRCLTEAHTHVKHPSSPA